VIKVFIVSLVLAFNPVLELLPGLSRTELDDFARQVPCRIPPEIEGLMGACRGFFGTVEQVDFTGRDLMFEFEPVFPS
jgi:hypothetical protein